MRKAMVVEGEGVRWLLVVKRMSRGKEKEEKNDQER